MVKRSLAADTCYWPMCEEMDIIRGRKVLTNRFLFGGWFFIEQTLGSFIEQYSRVMASPWVRGILMADEQPLMARGFEIERLRRDEVNGAKPRFRVGERVQVMAGALKSFIVTYTGNSEVEVYLLGKNSRVHVSERDLSSLAP